MAQASVKDLHILPKLCNFQQELAVFEPQTEDLMESHIVVVVSSACFCQEIEALLFRLCMDMALFSAFIQKALQDWRELGQSGRISCSGTAPFVRLLLIRRIRTRIYDVVY